MGFSSKIKLAALLDATKISSVLLKRLNKKLNNRYIRIINYHQTPLSSADNFEKQILWYKEHFDNINYSQFEAFMETGKLPGNKPGIMLTFDDGFEDNYTVAKDILEKHGMTGYFMLSYELLNTKKFMSHEQVKNLVSGGHIITCHTNTHHRMNVTDSDELLQYEIENSKHNLENLIKTPVDIFTWCGGEEKHYTKNAQNWIEKSNYKYGFTTNSKPVTNKDHHFCINRINVEASWPIGLLIFQICGIMDMKFKSKRTRVETLLKSK